MRGFTLLEFIISLSIISVLLLFSLPVYHDLIENHQANLAINRLHRAIYFARGEAIQRQKMVRLEPDGSWKNGMIVKAGGMNIKSFSNRGGKGEILWNSFPAYNYLQFTPQGFTYYQNGSFYYISSKGEVLKKLVINQAGRVRIE